MPFAGTVYQLRAEKIKPVVSAAPKKDTALSENMTCAVSSG
jgi:hypothetical protein